MQNKTRDNIMTNINLLKFDIKTNNSTHKIKLHLDQNKFSQNHIIKSFQSSYLFENSLSLFLIRVLQEGDVFYDIGAHVGYFSILSSFLVGNTGEVVAIEPEEENFKQLEVNMKINKKKILSLFKELFRISMVH